MSEELELIKQAIGLLQRALSSLEEKLPPTPPLEFELSGSATPGPVPYQKIIELYHEILPRHPRVKVLTDKRKSHIRARWVNGANNLKFWSDYFETVRGSRFLTGRGAVREGRRSFIADIDFLIREDVLVKTQEGKYHD